MITKDFANNAIDKVKSQFEKGEETILGYTIKVTRKNDAYHYQDRNGNIAVMSARYWAIVTAPDGTKKEFKKVKGGVIARYCGLWTRKERDDRNKQGDLHEITIRRNEIDY